MDQRAFGALAREDVHAIFTAFEGRLARGQAVFAFRPFNSMTTKARALKNGFDVAREVDLVRGRRRQFRFIDLGGQDGRADDQASQKT